MYIILDNQPLNQTTMPTPSVYPGSSQSQPFNAEPNSVPQPEVRVVHHVTYTLGPHSVKMSCPSCHTDIKTTTISDHQPSAHICCIVLCLLGWATSYYYFILNLYFLSRLSNKIFFVFRLLSRNVYLLTFLFFYFFSLLDCSSNFIEN